MSDINVSGSWKNKRDVWTRVSGTWRAGVVWTRVSGTWRTWALLPSSAVVMYDSTSDMPGSDYTDGNNRFVYFQSGGTGGTIGSSTTLWSGFGMAAYSVPNFSHTQLIRERTLFPSGYYNLTSVHGHSAGHAHSGSSNNDFYHYWVRPRTGATYLGVGALIFATSAISSPKLTEKTSLSSVDRILKMSDASTPWTTGGSSGISVSINSVSGYGGGTPFQNSYLRSYNHVISHRHDTDHSHSIAFSDLLRYRMRVYSVNARIYDLDELPVGSRIPATSSTGWPANWSDMANATAYPLAVRDATSGTVGSASSFSISSSSSTGTRRDESTYEGESGTDRYMQLVHTTHSNSHTHPTSVDINPIGRVFRMMVKTS